MQQKSHADELANGLHNRIAVSIDEAARLIGVGRTFLYAAIKQGTLRSLKVGGRRLLTVEAIEAWLKTHEEPVKEAARK